MTGLKKVIKMKASLLSTLFFVILCNQVSGQLVRKEMKVPDIPGYSTLKCDFHIHTVFSDGNVWPTIRVEEAWIMGYDAISITDHIEYQPHKKYIPINHNAGYEVARPRGERQNLIVIQGTEITRAMPLGHLNAIFIKDASRIETEAIHHMHHGKVSGGNYLDSIDNRERDFMHALEEAVDQGGFVFWNHPGWGLPPGQETMLHDVHKELIGKGWMMGIEVANWDTYYPEAFHWCLDHDLAMLSNSDIHDTEGIYEMKTGVRMRPVTLVFVKDRSENGIREALDEARTAVWFDDKVIGREAHLKPLFKNSIEIGDPFFTEGDGDRLVTLKNKSGFLLELKDKENENSIRLLPETSTIISLKKDQAIVNWEVSNFLVSPEKSLVVSLDLR